MWDRWDQSQEEAFEWANKAIELDEQNYVAALVLGRILMYQGAYETAEHYVRKSLMLNPNDADNLIELASCLVFMGYPEEALEVYQRAKLLNPVGKESYYPVGALVYLELGEFKKASEMAGKTNNMPWVDTTAYFAAIYHYLGDTELAEKYWQEFLDTYTRKINCGEPADPVEAIKWMKNVNPHKNPSHMEPYWEYKSNGSIPASEPPQTTEIQGDGNNSFLKQDDFWLLSFAGTDTRLTEVKGFHDLRKLLLTPGQPLHCAELMGTTIKTAKQPVIDEKARTEYQRRIRDLQQEISQAEEDNDLGRLGNLQMEYDQILQHLSSSLGLSGKVRGAGNPIEKARSAVTWRIRNAISKIEKAHPALGKHLSHAVKTGTFCTYDPENQVEWML